MSEEIDIDHVVDAEKDQYDDQHPAVETSRDRRSLEFHGRYMFIGIAGHLPYQIRTDHETEGAENDHGQRADTHYADGHVHMIAMCDKDRVHMKDFHDSADEEGLHHGGIG